MEGLAKETISSFHHPDVDSCSNDEFKLELGNQKQHNGAANTEHARENLLLECSKLGALKRREFFDNLLKNVDEDHLRFLQRQKERIDRVDVELPGIDVRYNNLFVEAESRFTNGNHLPSLWNSTKAIFSGLERLLGLKMERVKINILEDVSGIIKPGRLTLLLGPPGCGKSTLLRALAGKLDKSLKVQTLPFIINIRCLFSFSLIVSAPKDLRD